MYCKFVHVLVIPSSNYTANNQTTGVHVNIAIHKLPQTEALIQLASTKGKVFNFCTSSKT